LNPLPTRRSAIGQLARWAGLATTPTLAAWLGACASAPERWALQPFTPTAGQEPPPLTRELRGAWVASVAHIDWPSRAGLSVAEQRQEMARNLQTARSIGLNALFLQVRPSADALYPSALEPWSEYLTGTQGQAPQPLWDPLAEWLAGAREHGLELHAWLNPLRARSRSARSAPSAGHITQRAPQWVRHYGDEPWLDPAEPEARAHTLAVAEDVLRRYDLDGLHIDDYFYPYPVKDAQGQEMDFPDDAPWQRYLAQAGGGATLTRADWRRSHVDSLVQALNELTQTVRPGARFSVSPFGLGKPSLRPPGIEGFSQFDKLYADVERWQAQGWCDALVPQLYWAQAQTRQAFGPLLDYWRGHNPHGRHLWAGLFTSRIPAAGEAARPGQWRAQEVIEQIALTRQRGVTGHVHFSLKALLEDRDRVATRLAAELYTEAALPPASPWRGAAAPAAPRMAFVQGEAGVALRVAPGSAAAPPRHYGLAWRAQGGPWRWRVLPASQAEVALKELPGARELACQAYSATAVQGPLALVRLVSMARPEGSV
jgi:uncharacterized lipoprotein YddW (UPF0748 family)